MHSHIHWLLAFPACVKVMMVIQQGSCETGIIWTLDIWDIKFTLIFMTSMLCFACCVSYTDLFTARQLSELKTRVSDGYEVNLGTYSMFWKIIRSDVKYINTHTSCSKCSNSVKVVTLSHSHSCLCYLIFSLSETFHSLFTVSVKLSLRENMRYHKQEWDQRYFCNKCSGSVSLYVQQAQQRFKLNANVSIATCSHGIMYGMVWYGWYKGILFTMFTILV